MIRLVSAKEPKPLSIGDARATAAAAYTKAKAAQRALMSHMFLIEMLHRPGSVSYARLKGERHEARAQLERAQAVVTALDDAIAAMEAAATS